GAGHLQRVAAGVRLGQPEGQDLVAASGGGKVAAFLVVVAPGGDGVFADGGVPGEEGAHAGPFAANAREGLDVGDGVGAAPAVGGGDGHGEQVVFARQGDDLIVVAVLDVAQLLDRTNLLAERLDVLQQALLVGWGHE